MCANCALRSQYSPAYFRDADDGFCKLCGEEQVVGTAIMVGVATFMFVGATVGAMTYMRFFCDIAFKRAVLKVTHDVLITPLLKGNVFKVLCVRQERPVYVDIQGIDAGQNRMYILKNDLGFVFRVDEYSQF